MKRKIPKYRKKREARKEAQVKRRVANLHAFLRDYGSPEFPQETCEAVYDSQLKCLAMSLEQEMTKSERGAIIDIGCGNGALLSRLLTLNAFRENRNWTYLGIDHSNYRQEVINSAVERRIHRRVDFADLESFYSDWPSEDNQPRPHLAFVRNVFHELGVEESARLIWHVANHLKEGERFIIQDLKVFPKAERGNVCWCPQLLRRVVGKSGFEALLTEEKAQSGNQWFNIIATRTGAKAPSHSEVRGAVAAARRGQWQDWKELGALTIDDESLRDVRVAKIDFDLQFAALTLQLIEAGVSDVPALSSSQQVTILQETFTRRLETFELVPELIPRAEAARHFVDRANSTQTLIKFLGSDFVLTEVIGSPLMGKTELVKRVLELHSYSRAAVFVDIQATTSVWNVLEAILGAIGCRVPTEVLGKLPDISFQSIVPALQSFFSAYCEKLIIVFDHWENVLDPEDQVWDLDIRELMRLLVLSRSAKIIVTSRLKTDFSFLPQQPQYPDPQPPVGRFPEERHHVQNVLHVFVGRTEYPEALLDAIDRHPFMAVLSGLYLRAKGYSESSDSMLLQDLRGHLRQAILLRIADETSRHAIYAVSVLRVPVPQKMLVKLSSEESVNRAEELGLFRRQADIRRRDLLGCIGAIRLRVRGDIGVEEEDHDITEYLPPDSERLRHRTIADLYEELYREDEDPKWLREAYYHRMLLGEASDLARFGRIYRAELHYAGDHWFTRKDFEQALWAYRRAGSFGDESPRIKRRIASCLIRRGKRSEGEKMFEALIKEFKRDPVMKSSYVDALLYIADYRSALERLQEFGLSPEQHNYVAGQFGRAYLGLQIPDKALHCFRYQLREQNPHPFVYYNIGHAQHHLGETDQEKKSYEDGLRKYPWSRSLRLQLAALLERIGQCSEAKTYLEQLYEQDPCNAWVLFPLVKTLIRLGEVDRADRICRDSGQKANPEFLRKPIEAVVRRGQRKYEQALSLIKSIRREDEHSVGQKLEIYYQWACDTSDKDEAKNIACQGLSEPMPAELERNVPLLLSQIKLALFLEDKSRVDEVRNKIVAMNPKVSELRKIDERIGELWPA